jgi:hypothetical protein
MQGRARATARDLVLANTVTSDFSARAVRPAAPAFACWGADASDAEMLVAARKQVQADQRVIALAAAEVRADCSAFARQRSRPPPDRNG